MKLVLMPTELKIFSRAIQCLCKLGHEVYFEYLVDGLKVKTVNCSRSAFATIHLRKVFFDKCSDEGSENERRFKISCSVCCNVFKLTASLEKSILKCKVFLSDGCTSLVVQYFCKYGIVKTFNMSIIDCEHLEAVYSMEESANHLLVSVRLLSEVLNNFRQTAEELTVSLKEGECSFKNYLFPEEQSSVLTQVPVSATDFDAYCIQCENEVTFCQKEFRIILFFCELVSPLIRIYCDQPGKPLIIACTHETRLTARFVLATLPSDASISVSGSQRSQVARPQFLANRTPVQIKRGHDTAAITNISDTTHLGNLTSKENVHADKTILIESSSKLHPTVYNINTQVMHPAVDSFFELDNNNDDLIINQSVYQVCTDPPPIKKVRSALFTDTHSVTLLQDNLNNPKPITNNHYFDKTDSVLLSSTLLPENNLNMGHTVLVADSDEEN